MVETRRYLTEFHSSRTPHILSDVLVIGGGIAGLRAALAAAAHGQVLLITKGGLEESNTRYAQGGIAVPMPDRESIQSHIDDTMSVGCGLNSVEIAQYVIEHGPQRLKELIDLGVRFDHEGERLAQTLEGGHSQKRILHAHGDATGRELVQKLLAALRAHSNVRIFENCFAIDLITLDDRCVGAVTHHPQYSHQFIWANEVILATGGGGRLYRETTNPDIATADGLAMAYRAGAALRDLEFVQFHPTTLYVAGATRALISEAVRGEGGILIDRNGHRFMKEYHPNAELAPRDVVSQSMHQHMIRTQSTMLYLDVRHFKSGDFKRRFPGIAELCMEFGLNPETDLIPVRPSAHYLIGGVAVDREGQSSLPGLWVCGEAASTMLHGANRLASNSLLEGLVFGAEVGNLAGSRAALSRRTLGPHRLDNVVRDSKRTVLDTSDVKNSLMSLMGRNVGIVRSGDRLAETIEIMGLWSKYTLDKLFDDLQGWQVQNMLVVASLIAWCANERRESRGVHYRTDYPSTNDLEWKRHIEVTLTGDGGVLEHAQTWED